MTRTRRFLPLVAGAAALALAAPALADNVSVTLSGTGGTRQFSVEDLSGMPLTALDLTSNSQPFKIHVQDSAFLPSAGQSNYTVSATMSNLYLKTGSTYNYAVSIPSNALSIGFGSNPLNVSGLSLVDLPKLSISGLLSSCGVGGAATLATNLGLGLLANLTSGVVTALTNLCTAIGSSSAPVTAVVDGALQNVSNLVPASVLDAPTALTGAVGGSFTNPSFAAGTVGAGDTAGAAGAPAATAVTVMQGAQSLTSALANLIKNALPTNLPLVSATGQTALTTAQAVTAGLANAATGTASAAFGQLLQALTATQAASQINTVFQTIGFQTPVLSDIHAVTGNYYSTPVLQAQPRTPVAGTYGGTMTVTFVQS